MHSFKPAKAELLTVNKGACEERGDIDLLACSSFKDRQSTLSTNNMTLHRYLDSRPFVSWQQDHDLDVMRKRKRGCPEGSLSNIPSPATRPDQSVLKSLVFNQQ
jgi:hypothetical protein